MYYYNKMEDIWPLILENIGNMRKIIQLSQINKLLLRIIKTHIWYLKIFIDNNDILEYILNNFHIKNLCLSSACDVNHYINRLIYCHTLDLRCMNVTDDSVKKLIHCSILDLCFTNVSDAGVEKLIHCRKLYLYRTRVTDQCKQKLRNLGVVVM